MLSALQLKAHRFTQLRLESHPKGVPGDGIKVSTNLTWGEIDNSPGNWRLELKVDFGPAPKGNGPYSGVAEVVGFFKVSNALSPEKHEDLVVVNGASLLYGAVREMLLVMSARCSHGELYLPTLRFTPPEPPTEKKPAAKKAAKAPKKP